MQGDYLQEAVDELIRDVNSNSQISEAGLKEAMYPDDLILAIHNHLGNIKQMVSSEVTAFNASEQFEINKATQRELEELSSNLFSARQTDLISEVIYNGLNEKIRNITKVISDLTDPEYL